MFKNYLQVAFRNLKRNKSYVIINILGLGVALACCIAAYIFLAYNIEFDSFHANEKVKNTYKVHSQLQEKDGKVTDHIQAPIVLAPIAAEEIAGIEKFTRFVSWDGYMRHGDNSFNENIHFADSSFFDMFEFPLVQGSHKSFKDKSSIFISEELAKKYFGDEEAVGKTLILNFANDKEIQVVVGGVLAKVPLNNSFVFNSLMRVEHFMDINQLSVRNWGDWRDPSTFFQLVPGTNPENVVKQFAKYVPLRNEARKEQHLLRHTLQPFKSSFTRDDIEGSYANVRTSFLPILVFVSMAAMILLIACFNLTNTSIAMTSKRLKEVGIRKAIGAVRSQIVTQFLFETLLTITLALIVGLGMAQLIVPAFTAMWDLPYGIKDMNGVNLFTTLMVLVFIASLLAGIYPALFNSKFNPVSLLKGTVKVNGTNMLTRSLVSMQFALSVIVLISGVMFISNTKFQEAIKFGYDKEKIITIGIQSDKEFEAMRNAVERYPKIQSVAVSDHNVGYNNYSFPVKIDTSEYESRFMGIGNNYLETMGFTFIEGRPFKADHPSDSAESVVVNRAFLAKVGMKDPIDKIITVHDKKRHIIGVIENHVDNLFRSKEPEAFLFYPAQPKNYRLMVVRADQGDLIETKDYLEKTWKELFPTKAFSSQFQDDMLMKDMKQANGNLMKIFLFLTVLGGLLSASGIFSLASLNIARRTKEIGIRKALGASVGNVVALLNKEFVIVLSIAALVGGVGGFYIISALLDEIYAYHITVGVIPIVLCSISVFLMGILTTSSTILKAAKSNPVDTLRSE